MSDRRPLILVTNDDGVQSLGLSALRRAASEVADVIVVAPTREQSAQSHAITLDRPLRHIEHETNVHSIDGTPADCVYLALFERRFLPRRPDLVLSGINRGHNLGTSVFYSGTVAAAREAAMRGIPAMALSAPHDADTDQLTPIVTQLVSTFIEQLRSAGLTPLLNVNFPRATCRGTRVTRVGRQVYDEQVIPRVDPSGREYFWIGARVTQGSEPEGTDAHAIALGYASITPLALESTSVEHWAIAAQIAQHMSLEGDMP
jgi:5'-nucleotidase